MPVSSRKRAARAPLSRRWAKRNRWDQRKRYNRRSNLSKYLRNAAIKATEMKYTEYALENQALYHNGGTGPFFAQWQDMLNMSQGSGAGQRLGDSINGVGISLKLWLSQKNDRPNCMWRILVYRVPYDVANPTDLFDATGNGNRMLSYVNKEKYSVVYQKFLRPLANDFSLETGATLRERSRSLNILIPMKNKTITYRLGLTTPTSERNRLFLAIIPYDAFGTLTTDSIASYAGNFRFYYKDP